MSAKSMSGGIEVIDLGYRRLYVKRSNGFVLHHDDLTPQELLGIATDIACQAKPSRTAFGADCPTSGAATEGPLPEVRTIFFH